MSHHNNIITDNHVAIAIAMALYRQSALLISSSVLQNVHDLASCLKGKARLITSNWTYLKVFDKVSHRHLAS